MAVQFIIIGIIIVIALLLIVALTTAIVYKLVPKKESLTVVETTSTNMPQRIRGGCSPNDLGTLRCVSA